MSTYTKKDFLAHSDQLAPNGFIRQRDEPWYIKKLADRELRIYFFVNKYFPYSVVIQGLSARISFYRVEEIYNEVLQNYPLDGQDSNEMSATIGGAVLNVTGVDYSLLDVHDVEDDASFNVVKPHLQLLVDAALQFFDDYETVQDVFDYTESLTIPQMAKFVTKPMPYRRMIIKKLVNDSNYESYAQQVLDFYITENDTMRVDFVKALIEKLRAVA